MDQLAGKIVNNPILRTMLDMTREGYGWEDVFAELRRRRLVKDKDRDAVRTLVLGMRK